MKIICVLPRYTKRSTAPWLRMEAFHQFFAGRGATEPQLISPETPTAFFRAVQESGTALLATLRKEKEPVVVFHRSAILWPWLLIAKYRYKAIIIQDFHGMYWRERWIRKKFLSALFFGIHEAITTRLSHHVVAVSRAVASQLANTSKDRVAIIPNGISVEELSATVASTTIPDDVQPLLNTQTKKVGFVGNADVWFDFQFVLDAAKPVDNVELFLIGDGPALSAIEEEAKGNPSIHLLGRRPHPQAMAILSKMDAFITPYNPDYPYSQVPGHYAVKKNKEYLYFEKPLFVSDVPAKDEFLVGSDAVWWYNPAELSTLTRALSELSDDKVYQRKRAATTALSSEISLVDLIKRSALGSWLPS